MKKMLNNLTNLLLIVVMVIVVTYVLTLTFTFTASDVVVDYEVNEEKIAEVEAVKANNHVIKVAMVEVTYLAFTGYEVTGYVDRNLFVDGMYDVYSSVSDTATVYNRNMQEIGEVYSFGWLWNCTNTTLSINTDISNVEADYDIPVAVTNTVDAYSINYVLVEAFNLLVALVIAVAIYVACMLAVVVGTIAAVRRANREVTVIDTMSASMYTEIVEQEHLVPAELMFL